MKYSPATRRLIAQDVREHVEKMMMYTPRNYGFPHRKITKRALKKFAKKNIEKSMKFWGCTKDVPGTRWWNPFCL